jgi:hypothetical protein
MLVVVYGLIGLFLLVGAIIAIVETRRESKPKEVSSEDIRKMK